MSVITGGPAPEPGQYGEGNEGLKSKKSGGEDVTVDPEKMLESVRNPPSKEGKKASTAMPARAGVINPKEFGVLSGKKVSAMVRNTAKAASQGQGAFFRGFAEACKNRIVNCFDHPEDFGLEPNFLGTDRTEMSDVHESQLISRLCVIFDQFMESTPLKERETEKMSSLYQVHEKLTKGVELKPDEKKMLLEHLAERAICKTGSKELLYTDKLFLSPANYFLELPAHSAVPSNTEAKNNKILAEQLGVPKTILSREAGKHETYGKVIARNEGGQEITLGNVFGGALQGIYRQNITTKEALDQALDKYGITKPDRRAEFHLQRETKMLGAGSLSFDFRLNERVKQDNLDLLGSAMMELAERTNSEFQELGQRLGFEGFTAGISGNALHYSIATAELCQSRGQAVDLPKLKQACLSHLVGDSYIKPLHHSLPETLAGLYIGLALFKRTMSKSSQEPLELNALQALLETAIDQAKTDAEAMFKGYRSNLAA